MMKVPKPGFPQDDEFSLQQMAGECGNLDCWYDHQFIQNETTNTCRGGIRSTFQMEHTPVDPGTMTFTVYDGIRAIQTGFVKSTGECEFQKIGNPEVYAVAGNLNHATGEVCVRFNKEPGSNCLVASYEYNLETQFSDQ